MGTAIENKYENSVAAVFYASEVQPQPLLHPPEGNFGFCMSFQPLQLL